MNDTQIGNWMRSLPRETASPRFSSEVMRAIRGAKEGGQVSRRRRAPIWRIAAALAMAACVVIAVQVSMAVHAQRQRAAALRAERQRIESELAAVKRIANDAEPVVVLENDQGTRVIMDLDSAIQPASLRTFD
jgi:hypothetical protein